MLRIGFLAAALLLGLLPPAIADERLQCLSRNDQRAAIANGGAVRLADAIRAAGRAPREVVRARLCKEPTRLVYLLTVLARDGKVKRETIDAATGTVVGER